MLKNQPLIDWDRKNQFVSLRIAEFNVQRQEKHSLPRSRSKVALTKFEQIF